MRNSVLQSCPRDCIASECDIAYIAGVDTTSDIIERLLSRGLSQAEIARRSGIPQPRLSRWANGAVPAGADDALKLAALEVELIGAEGAPTLPSAVAAAAAPEPDRAAA